MNRWKILRGILNDSTVIPVNLVEIEGVERVDGDGVYYPGDVIETDKDLGRHNHPSEPKFEKLTVIQPISESTKDLSKMTIPALKKLAEEEDIDLGDATLRDEIVEAIQSACV